MSLSDCPECWDTPCTCGWEYKHWDINELFRMKQIFEALVKYKAMYKKHLPAKEFHMFIQQSIEEKDKL